MVEPRTFFFLLFAGSLFFRQISKNDRLSFFFHGGGVMVLFSFLPPLVLAVIRLPLLMFKPKIRSEGHHFLSPGRATG